MRRVNETLAQPYIVERGGRIRERLVFARYREGVDAMSALVDSARANGAFVLLSHLASPWAMRIDDEAPVCVLVVLRGAAEIIPRSGPPVRLNPGDVGVVTRALGSYVVADSPSTRPSVAIDATQTPTPLHTDAAPMRMLGVRAWGNSDEPETLLVSGTYQARGEVSDSVLKLLPPLLVVSSESPDPVVGLLASEIASDAPGQDRMLDRILDLVLVRTLRTWFADQSVERTWMSAARDREIGRALHLMHEQPQRDWTIATLAGAVGMSRAAFARRFTRLVGTPPLAYLTDWRLMRAADELRTTTRTLADIATEVGYGSSFALSAAFRRSRGESPRDYRRRTAGA
jgi:AraC-like DNA-binding protein